jgi:hypothetical protein
VPYAAIEAGMEKKSIDSVFGAWDDQPTGRLIGGNA